MSGPKTLHYQLTPEQRRILEEQRKIRTELALIAKQEKEAHAILSAADHTIRQMQPLFADLEVGSEALQSATAQRVALAAAAERAMQAKESDGLQQLQETTQALQKAATELTTAAKLLTQQQAAAEEAFHARMGGRIDTGISLSFDAVGSKNALAEKIRAELDRIGFLTLSYQQAQRLEMLRHTAEEITDEDFRKNFYAMTVLPFAKECRAYDDAYRKFGAEYRRKLCIYEENAKTLGIPAQPIPFSPEAIRLLDARIAETEAAIHAQEEQAYISRCVDEAMQELGYHVLGSRDVVRRSGKKFHNALYHFDEGTAVNVTYSNDGQITMELGGISAVDRAPTDAECADLVEDMESFCGDFQKIRQHLQQRGILVSRVSMLPPEEQYAQIFNVSDYTLQSSVTEYQVAPKKQHTQENKTKRIGDT